MSPAVRDLLGGGGWAVDAFDDGLLVLRRDDAAPPLDVLDLPVDWLRAPVSDDPLEARSLISAELVPVPMGALDVDGPRATLHTVWRAEQPLPAGTRLAFLLDLRGPEQVSVWDVPAVWWYPPERWAVGQPVAVDISDVPRDRFLSWQGVVTSR